MVDPVSALLRICTPLHQGTAVIGTHLAAMALLGLAGSLVHCGPMCGPLVLGQSAARLACVPCAKMNEASRLHSALLPGYHAGRIATYAALGALAGLTGMGVAVSLRPLRGAVLALAALALLGAAWRTLRPGSVGAAAMPFQGRLLRRLRPGGLGFGLALGLLPCGLLYTALLAAAATASPLWGAAGMAAFGAGTVPMLAAIGLAGNIRVLRPWLTRAAPILFAVNAIVLLVASFRAA